MLGCTQARFRFISFLHAVGRGDGEAAARHLLSWGSHNACGDPAALAADMQKLFARHSRVNSTRGIDLDRVMKEVLVVAREHEVGIDSKYASLVLGLLILVGFAQGMDPHLNLMDAAIPCLLTYNLTGRIVGRLY